MTERYRLVFHGSYAPGFNAADVITRLTDLLGTTRIRVNAMIARPPAIVASGLELGAAKQRYFEMADIGFLTILEIDDTPPNPSWDGVERRMGERRRSEDRRQGDREHKGEDRRKGDRRKG